MQDRRDVSDATKRAILGGTARRMYGLS
jgi:hypothetical protein